ncbi:MAG: RnfABCDGE type electron transport complex subunit B [Rikenellaceae bacterium]|nr:RnfABCDGE type electron transport complex subunit B [Rikenellaceae bacterium]MCL2692240.1 RnfABCDGE type electron transport complex subunit B [Rikenellaceae bacterium]
MNETLIAVLTTAGALVGLGVFSAAVLYLVSLKFKVDEDPRIDTVEALLSGANCGGCGLPGCRGLAEMLVGEDDISKLYCPPAGADTMGQIATMLGKAAPAREPSVAVVRCAGSYARRERTNRYDGAGSCAVAAALYGGETGCTFGCLSEGDCVRACPFDAIHMNPETGLPEVVDEKCTACGKCVTACPKALIELRRQGARNRRVCVTCRNRDKGAVARKVCEVACIACGKCVKACTFDAIVLENNLAFIDSHKCKLCRKCVPECPTGAIEETGFPARKEEKETV